MWAQWVVVDNMYRLLPVDSDMLRAEYRIWVVNRELPVEVVQAPLVVFVL